MSYGLERSIDTFKDARKYVIMTDKKEKQINIINLEDKLENYMTNIQEAIKNSGGQ